MKEKKRFRKAIQYKFVFLRLFIAIVIVLFSVVCVFFVQDIARNSTEVIDNRLPKLHVAQEVQTSILLATLYANALLNEDELSDVSSLDENEQRFNSAIVKTHVLLDALIYGSDTEEFRSMHEGVNEQLWREYGLEGIYEVYDPSEELSTYARDIHANILVFQDTVLQAKAIHDEHIRIQNSEEPDPVKLEELHMQELALEEKIATELTTTVASLLGQMQTLLESQVFNDISSVNEDMQSKQLLISLTALLAVFITLFVGLVFSNRIIVRPLQELTAVAEEMAEGKLSKRVTIRSRDEIGKLAFTFNKMAARLEQSYDNLEKIVKDKTDALSVVVAEFEMKNADLEKSQRATINLLEDLEEEKHVVENRVRLRTRELENEKNKLLQVTSNMKGGGILLDRDQNVIFVNDATYDMLNIERTVDADAILGLFFAHFKGDEITKHFKECVEGKTLHVPEIDGAGERVYEIFFHHLQDNEKNGGESSGYFILFFDISEAKLLERSKSELVAVASHQLRTPLTAMRGNVEMLIDETFGALNKEQHELLDDIDVSTARLITMVNDMLDITKIERNDLEMNIERLQVKEIIDSVIADLSVYAQRHEFTIETKDLSPLLYVNADKVRIRQVFQNLIDNAIKYSRHPGVLTISSSESGTTMEIAFKDNGIGIPKEEQSKLFDRFYRASNTSKTTSSGSGLGLYIVKSIANQLGGDIRFESEENVGTTFFVSLPIANNN